MEKDQGSPIGSLMVSNVMECNFVFDFYFVMSVFRCKTFCPIFISQFLKIMDAWQYGFWWRMLLAMLQLLVGCKTFEQMHA
jgi:hypothetical protein